MTEMLPPVPHFKSPNRSITTGSWRTFRPVLNMEKCNMCLLCWLFCPDGTIKRVGDGLTVDYDFCKGCGVCAKECRRKAITMVEEV